MGSRLLDWRIVKRGSQCLGACQLTFHWDKLRERLGRFIGPLACLRNSLVTWHSCERDKEISVKQPPHPLSHSTLLNIYYTCNLSSTHTHTHFLILYKCGWTQDGWVRAPVLLFLWIFKRVGKRTVLYSGCWVTGPQWQEALLVKWQIEIERKGERDACVCVCGIWKELLLAVLDIYSFLKQWGVWWKKPVMFLMLQWK